MAAASLLLTRYERAYLIGVRLAQLEGGSLPVFSLDPIVYRHLDLMTIAERDVQSGALKWTIDRRVAKNHVTTMVLLPDFRCCHSQNHTSSPCA